MNSQKPHRNALADQSSPYLQQHADNPVDWYPWDADSLALAREQDKPILLSIGYSACHWCHVMAHESFEDPATAAVMNELFINIKVDREERPDLDKIYQTAHQLLAGRPGGWPLTVFLSPDNHIPFFAGTYFPREQRYGMPAFTELMRRIVGLFRERRDQLQQQNSSLMEAMSAEHRIASGAASDGASEGPVLSSAPLDQARRQLADSFDNTHAGFGAAPKFPHPTSLNRLLRHYRASRLHGHPDPAAWEMLDQTLTNMARGGLYDQLGGGFFRYSVDELWMIPHFEKMLYDNAQLLGLYAEASAAQPDGPAAALYQRCVRETADWVMRDMQAPEGGYWSTLDADSEGAEGRFYVWKPEQVRELLDADEYALIAACFGLDRDANFEGAWHLHGYRSIKEQATAADAAPSQERQRLDSARAKLLQARSQRTAPGRDEKVLTAWNGLMIRGMAVAGRIFELDELVASAERAARFVRQTLWQGDRLLASYKDGEARLPAYLDDHAFMMDALLALLEVRWNQADLALAVALAERLLEGFADPQGGFFFTANDHEQLFHRPKPFGDDALPAGNGIAASALSRLGHLLGEPRYLQAAEDSIKAAWPLLSQAPMGHEAMLDALEQQLQPAPQVILRASDATARQWRRALREAMIDCPVYAIPSRADDLPPALQLKQPDGDCVAYLCQGQRCSPPMQNPHQLVEALSRQV